MLWCEPKCHALVWCTIPYGTPCPETHTCSRPTHFSVNLQFVSALLAWLFLLCLCNCRCLYCNCLFVCYRRGIGIQGSLLVVSEMDFKEMFPRLLRHLQMVDRLPIHVSLKEKWSFRAGELPCMTDTMVSVGPVLSAGQTQYILRCLQFGSTQVVQNAPNIIFHMLCWSGRLSTAF